LLIWSFRVSCKFLYSWGNIALSTLNPGVMSGGGRCLFHFPLTTFLLIRYGEVRCIHKYPMMVWTHQLLCCESSVLLSVFNSHLFLSSSSMPRPLAYRHSLPLSNRYYVVVLKSCNEVMFFISVIPSEIRRFKFTVSWLCDDHIAADNLRRKRSSTSRYDSPLFVLSKDYSFQRLTWYWLPPASVNDSHRSELS
jgi:hypothetical protein